MMCAQRRAPHFSVAPKEGHALLASGARSGAFPLPRRAGFTPARRAERRCARSGERRIPDYYAHTIERVGALPRPVKALGLVSLLTDASSEMIYPLLPAFVTGTLRAGPAFLGLVEGAAEAVASLVKLLAGRASDRLPR